MRYTNDSILLGYMLLIIIKIKYNIKFLLLFDYTYDLIVM